MKGDDSEQDRMVCASLTVRYGDSKNGGPASVGVCLKGSAIKTEIKAAYAAQDFIESVRI